MLVAMENTLENKSLQPPTLDTSSPKMLLRQAIREDLGMAQSISNRSAVLQDERTIVLSGDRDNATAIMRPEFVQYYTSLLHFNPKHLLLSCERMLNWSASGI